MNAFLRKDKRVNAIYIICLLNNWLRNVFVEMHKLV